MPSITKRPTSASEESAGYTIPWNWESSIYSAGTAQAQNNTGSCATTHKLVADDFNISKVNLPDNCKVTGVKVTIIYANNTPLNSGCSKIHAVSVSAGSSYASKSSIGYVAGTNTNSLQTWTIGGSDTLWGGLSDDPRDYDTMSIRYWATVAPGGYTSFVDDVLVTIYYTEPDYSVTASVPASAVMGQEFNYTINLNDVNKITQGRPIPVSINLGSGLTYVRQTGGNGSYNTSTKKWTAVLSNYSAKITLVLKATSGGVKSLNAGVDGYPDTVTKSINIVVPNPDMDISISVADTMELVTDNDITITLSGQLYDTHAKQVNVDLPVGFRVQTSSVVASSNVSNVSFVGGILSFNLTNLNSYNFSLSYKITVNPHVTGDLEIGVYNDALGVSSLAYVTVLLTQAFSVRGSKTSWKSVTGHNVLGFAGGIQGTVRGTKLSMSSTCKVVMDVIKGYIGPIYLELPHSAANLVNSTKNSLIKEPFRNGANIGKKGDFTEDMPFDVYLSPGDALTLQELAKLDEPVPVNTRTWAPDGDPLNQKGYLAIYEVDIAYFNPDIEKCTVKGEWLTRTLKPPIYIHRLSQVNKYNIKPQYPVTTFDMNTNLSFYFDITTSNGTVNNRTITLSGIDNAVLKSKNIISDPATIVFTWNSSTLENVERIIRIRDENNTILLEYTLVPIDNTGVEVDAYIDIYDEDGSVDSDDYEIDLVNTSGVFSTIQNITIDENIIGILDEGLTGVELSEDSLALPTGNYYFEIEIKHTASTNSTTTFDLEIEETHLLNNEKSYFVDQIVSSFPLPDKTLQYTRLAEDGLLYYYKQDNTISCYYCEPFVLYKGGTNITTENGASLLSNRIRPDPIVLTNGLVKVMFSFSFRMIWIYMYDPESNTDDGWVLCGRFRMVNMENIIIDLISRDKSIINCGGTTWTIYTGRKSIDIVHSNQHIYVMDKKNRCKRDDGDGTANEETLTTIETLLSLNNLYYLLLYNNEDDYGLQIIRPDYDAIYNTYIPKNEKTVIIPYKKDDKDHDQPDKLAIEWLNMYEQKINLNGQ